VAEEMFDTGVLVRACQELGQLEGAVELVRRVSNEAMAAGRWSDGLVTLELLPMSVRRAHPDLCLAESRALLQTGRPKEATLAAETAMQHGGRTDDVDVQVSAIVELALIGILSGDVSVSEDWLSAAEHLLRNAGLPTERRRVLEGRAQGVRGMCLATRGRTVEAREAFESAERVLKLVGPSGDLALVQQNFGVFCNRVGDFEKAETELSAAVRFYRTEGDQGRLAHTLIALGEIYLRLGDVEKAGATLESAETAARDIGATRSEPWIVLALGQWHRASGRIGSAVEALDRAVEMAVAASDRELLLQALVFRAEVAIVQSKLDLARDLLERAQAEAQRLGSDSFVASAHRALGRLHLADGAGGRALSHLEAALQRGGEQWSPDERAETLYWLGTTYIHLDRPLLARQALEQALQIIDEAHRPAMLQVPAGEDARLLQFGLDHGLNPGVLRAIAELAATRQPWSGGVKPTAEIRVVAKNELPRLEARLFDSFEVYSDGALLETPSKVRELLALLILNPKGLPDESITEQMWPEMTPERALHNLQTTAYKLRNALSKPAVRFGDGTYQLSPQVEVVADVQEFDKALARARGTTGEQQIQFLSVAVELYRDPLLAGVAWRWVETARADYRARFIEAALNLADLVAASDLTRSDLLAERVVAVAPDTDMAYERLIHNARTRRDPRTLRRTLRRYETAAAQYGFNTNPRLLSSAL